MNLFFHSYLKKNIINHNLFAKSIPRSSSPKMVLSTCLMVVGVMTRVCWAIYSEEYHRLDGNILYQRLDPIANDPSRIRDTRNTYQGQYPQNKVRFGWQNPIRVAPTLPPRQSYATSPSYEARRSTTTEYYRDSLITSESQQHSQYVKYPPEQRPTTQAQTGRQKCSIGSRLDKRDERCIRLGSSCGENMAFYEDPTAREYGQCDCLQDTNRPLMYHRETDKCYFLFQQTFCRASEWLTVDSRFDSQPICEVNPCRRWVNTSVDSNWNWKDNDRQKLDRYGIVPLINERTCAVLGWPCRQEGKQNLGGILSDRFSQEKEISLAFEGTNLVCRRETGLSEFDSSSKDFLLSCRPGLFNKWRQEGHCKNF